MSHNVTAIPLSPLECNLKIVLQSQLYQDSSEEQERVLQLVQEDAHFASVSSQVQEVSQCPSLTASNKAVENKYGTECACF